MKTTIEIPDDLFRQAKARAALDGLPLKAFMIHGLHLALQMPPSQIAGSRRANFPLIHSTPGATPLTDDDVAAALANMDEEEAQQHANLVRR